MGSCNQFQMSRLHRGDIPLKLLETPLNVVKYYIEVVLRAPKVTAFWPKSAKIANKLLRNKRKIVNMSLFEVVLPSYNLFFIPDTDAKIRFSLHSKKSTFWSIFSDIDS